MMAMRVLHTGHRWCIILLYWGVADIATYPYNHQNCSDGYYWDTSAQEPGQPDNGLARCAKCSELCEFQQDLQILLTNAKCHAVKQCQILLDYTFIATCANGFIWDLATEMCVPCDYTCDHGFIQMGMQNICHVVCSIKAKIENETIFKNENNHTSITQYLKISYIICVPIVCVTMIIIGITVTVGLLIYFDQKRKCNSPHCDKNSKRVSKVQETRINVHELDRLISNKLTQTHQNQPKLHTSQIEYLKPKCIDNATLHTQQNQFSLQINSDIKEQTKSSKPDISIANDDLKLAKNCDKKSMTHNNTSTDIHRLQSSAATQEHNESSKCDLAIAHDYSNLASGCDEKTITDQSKSTDIIPFNKYTRSSNYKRHKGLYKQDNKANIIENEIISLSYTNPKSSGYYTYVSETPISIDIFGNDDFNVVTEDEDEFTFSYTSATSNNVPKPISTYPSEYSSRSYVTSIAFNYHANASMAGMSLYSYTQPGSLNSYVLTDNLVQPSSEYSFKETVYHEDDFKTLIDQNDTNAPHIKGAEEHGNLTADEIEQLPKDLSDIPDIQTKLQYLAQKQYVKRIISNGRYIKAWYDALDQVNAERFIGQVLGVSKKHYCCEYVYNHKA